MASHLNVEELRFDFVAGVRERLGNYLPQDLAFDVLSHTSNFVARNTHERITFPALLAAPELVGNLEITPEAEAFAWVSADVLRRYGGEYARLADKLKSSFAKKESDYSNSVQGELTSAEFSEREAPKDQSRLSKMAKTGPDSIPWPISQKPSTHLKSKKTAKHSSFVDVSPTGGHMEEILRILLSESFEDRA